MPRIARGLSDDYIYHVLNRGNNKQKIFHDDRDYGIFIKLMKEAKKRCPVKIFSYCLMPTHFHMVLKASKAWHLSKFMQWLMTSHVRRYHFNHGTSGHVWQGRFKSFIIQEDEHLLSVMRYVEANPVRAEIVKSAAAWLWSSHRESTRESMRCLADRPPISLPEGWNDFVNDSIPDTEIRKLRQSITQRLPYGKKEWQARIFNSLGMKCEPRPRGRPKLIGDRLIYSMPVLAKN